MQFFFRTTVDGESWKKDEKSKNNLTEDPKGKSDKINMIGA